MTSPIEREALVERPYADQNHPGNKLRPTVRCMGCGNLGCVTYWGRWCLPCNVARLDRIGAVFDTLQQGGPET